MYLYLWRVLHGIEVGVKVELLGRVGNRRVNALHEMIRLVLKSQKLSVLYDELI